MTRQTLDMAGDIDDLLGIGVAVVECLEVGGFVEGLGDRAEHGDRLGDLVAECVGIVERAAGITDRRARSHRPERDDLRDVVVAVLLTDVIEHRIAPVVGEVHIDIGHGDTFGIEESLEEEGVLDRIHVGDAGQIRHEAPRRTAATRAYDDVIVLGPVGIVCHDEEV